MVKELIDSCCEIFEIILGKKNIVHIILSGSGARNELVIYKIGDKSVILGDLELYIFVNKIPTSKVLKKICNEIHRLELKLQPDNPLFHIDYSIMRVKKIKSLRPSFQFFETAHTGKVIKGENIFDRFKSCKIDFNGSIISNTVYKLWPLFLSLMHKEKEGLNKIIILSIIFRIGHDIILGILLKEGICMWGFENRYKVIQQLFSKSNLNLKWLFKYKEYIDACHRFRKNPESFTLEDENKWFRISVKCLLEYCLRINNIDILNYNMKKQIRSIIANSDKVFPSKRNLKRFLYECYMVIRLLKSDLLKHKFPIWSRLKWLRNKKERLINLFLLLLAMNYLEKFEDNELLSLLREISKKLHYSDFAKKDGYNLETLCADHMTFLLRFHRFYQSKIHYYLSKFRKNYAEEIYNIY